MSPETLSLPLSFKLPPDALRHVRILAAHWDITPSELLALSLVGMLSNYFPSNHSDEFQPPDPLPDDIREALSTLINHPERN